jgi:hypothetical protein
MCAMTLITGRSLGDTCWREDAVCRGVQSRSVGPCIDQSTRTLDPTRLRSSDECGFPLFALCLEEITGSSRRTSIPPRGGGGRWGGDEELEAIQVPVRSRDHQCSLPRHVARASVRPGLSRTNKREVVSARLQKWRCICTVVVIVIESLTSSRTEAAPD